MKATLQPGWWMDAEDRPWRFDGEAWHSPCAGRPIPLDDPLLDSSMPLPLRPMVVFQDEPMWARRPEEQTTADPVPGHKRPLPAPLLLVVRPGGREVALSRGAVDVLDSRDVRVQADLVNRAVQIAPSRFDPPATFRLMPIAGGGATIPIPGLASSLRLAAFDQVALRQVDGRLLGRAG